MADEERDPKVSQRYRELGQDEPPREVDAAILAAARGAAEARPAPLVVPSGRRRWYFPLAAAAVIVLAAAVTVQMQREQPDPEAVTEAPAPPAAQLPKEAQAAEQPKPPPTFTPDPKPEPRTAPSREMRAQRDAARAEPQAPRAASPAAQLESPERTLERIADLRRQGRHEEADKALAEFRRRYPGYKIPEAMLEKVEKR